MRKHTNDIVSKKGLGYVRVNDKRMLQQFEEKLLNELNCFLEEYRRIRIATEILQNGYQ
ncbi:hypothetical protein AB3Z07_02675 [Metabacillus halosaccharovorans]|uniref:Uncharacterized protein n=2 Tax=Bacillaceae TaxID=186817 RepID=A0ABX7E153_9BACI|nr:MULTISPECIES: hypothetical protein [Bacillaceae]QQZ09043.1 hypothetical protein I5776_18975 [Heyndrickxia vini]